MPTTKKPPTKKPPTCLQIFHQKQRILDLKEKLHTEEWRLTMMLHDIPQNTRLREKIIISNDVFQVEAFNPSHTSPSCEIARIGSLEELKGLVCT